MARGVAIGFLILGLTGADDVALPFLARELGAGDVGIGVLYAAVAVGLVAGFALLARGRFPMTPAAGFIGGCVVVGIGETLTGVAGAIVLAVVFQMVRGVGTAAIDVNLQTLLQRSVAPAMLGRVFANVYGAVGIAAAALGRDRRPVPRRDLTRDRARRNRPCRVRGRGARARSCSGVRDVVEHVRVRSRECAGFA